MIFFPSYNQLQFYKIWFVERGRYQQREALLIDSEVSGGRVVLKNPLYIVQFTTITQIQCSKPLLVLLCVFSSFHTIFHSYAVSIVLVTASKFIYLILFHIQTSWKQHNAILLSPLFGYCCCFSGDAGFLKIKSSPEWMMLQS